jgi:chromate reductase, NAD(P)H dehydrogenase (quinone)
MADLKVLGITGSLRKASYNTAALRACQELLPQGMSLRITSIADLPMYNQDVFDAGLPDPVKRFRKEVAEADGLLIASPEYNFSVPGVLKNAIDWGSRPYGDSAWSGKPVALMSAAMGVAGGIRAQYQVRQCFVFLNMDAVVQPEVAIASAPQRFDEMGNLTDETSKKMIRQLLENLIAKARRLRQPMRQAA